MIVVGLIACQKLIKMAKQLLNDVLDFHYPRNSLLECKALCLRIEKTNQAFKKLA